MSEKTEEVKLARNSAARDGLREIQSFLNNSVDYFGEDIYNQLLEKIWVTNQKLIIAEAKVIHKCEKVIKCEHCYGQGGMDFGNYPNSWSECEECKGTGFVKFEK